MRAGLVPASLLFAALGLVLALAPGRVRALSSFVFVATLGVFSFLKVPQAWLEFAFFGCWVAVLVTAVSVHLGSGLGLLAALVLAVDAGIWANAVLSLAGSRVDLLKAVPCTLIVVPASWVVRRRGSLPVKVVSSWIMAVAVLAISLQLLPVTPGYLPDHLE